MGTPREWSDRAAVGACAGGRCTGGVRYDVIDSWTRVNVGSADLCLLADRFRVPLAVVLLLDVVGYPFYVWLTKVC